MSRAARLRSDDRKAQPEAAPASAAPLAGAPALPVRVGDRDIAVDSEGYLLDLDDWSEAFAEALARREGLVLTAAHWELIRFLRAYYHEHGVQPQVRVMLRHFGPIWGPERGSNHHLHAMFPRGGPQKQGNRLAGLLRTKGEH